jgi:hypothetical protein
MVAESEHPILETVVTAIYDAGRLGRYRRRPRLRGEAFP